MLAASSQLDDSGPKRQIAHHTSSGNSNAMLRLLQQPYFSMQEISRRLEVAPRNLITQADQLERLL